MLYYDDEYNVEFIVQTDCFLSLEQILVQMPSFANEHNHHLDYWLVLHLVDLVVEMQVGSQLLFESQLQVPLSRSRRLQYSKKMMEQMSRLRQKIFQYLQPNFKHLRIRIISCPGQVVFVRRHRVNSYWQNLSGNNFYFSSNSRHSQIESLRMSRIFHFPVDNHTASWLLTVKVFPLLRYS